MKQKGNRYCYPRSDKLESNRLRTWVTDCMFSIETRNPKHEIRNKSEIRILKCSKRNRLRGYYSFIDSFDGLVKSPISRPLVEGD